MNTHFDTHFQKNIVTILPGEFYASKDDIFISTVLGSCISITLYDPELHLGGINHFMLPSSFHAENISEEEQGRYGDFAIELLINSMLKQGSSKSALQAKVFGGSNVLDNGGFYKNQTGLNNICFALNFLETEQIPIIANDTGGVFPRKIFFHPQTAKIYLKRIQRSIDTVEEIAQRETTYAETLQREQKKSGDITWF